MMGRPETGPLDNATGKDRAGMTSTAIALFAVLAVLMVIARVQGPEVFSEGYRTSFTQLLRFLPILVVAMLVAGYTEVLLPEDIVERWLSEARIGRDTLSFMVHHGRSKPS